MSLPVGGIDPCQDTFTVGIVDGHGVEIAIETFANTAASYGAETCSLAARGVERVGAGVGGVGSPRRDRAGRCGVRPPRSPGLAVRGPAPLTATGQDRRRRRRQPQPGRFWPNRRSGTSRRWRSTTPSSPRSRRCSSTAELWQAARTLMLHHAADQISKLPTEVRDQLATCGKTESRLGRLEQINPDTATTAAGTHRLGWLQALIDQDQAARRQIRLLERLIDELLDRHGTTLRDEPGIGTISAATLLCEAGDPRRFNRDP